MVGESVKALRPFYKRGHYKKWAWGVNTAEGILETKI